MQRPADRWRDKRQDSTGKRRQHRDRQKTGLNAKQTLPVAAAFSAETPSKSDAPRNAIHSARLGRCSKIAAIVCSQNVNSIVLGVAVGRLGARKQKHSTEASECSPSLLPSLCVVFPLVLPPFVLCSPFCLLRRCLRMTPP